ncbi:MAG: ABC transporter substrate-binding protein [candidate division NC10 bacterium RBG_16_65_8]|nr:MAG: ABC transporter substrate-binding protein [candidate division NC10 bacterium RBG_16_65_8]
MKPKTLFVSMVAICLALWAVPVLAGEKVAEVKIGAIYPLSGGAANQGNQTRAGAIIAADEINANGGIPALGGAKIKLIFADSQSKPDVGASETERVLQRENVDLFIGAYQSAVTIVTTEVAERYKVPWLVTGSVADKITERGFKYIFRPNNKAVYDAREQLEAIATLTKETGKGPKSIGILAEGTDWGKSHAANVRIQAKEKKYEIVFDEAYTPGTVDFSAQILKIKSRKPEALILAMYTPDHIVFTKQSHEGRLDIPYGIHSVGAGSEDPNFYKAVPAQAIDYMFVQEDFQIDITEVAPWTQAVDKKFREMLGYELTSYGAQGYSAVYTIYDVLQRAGSVDKEKVRDALAKTNITSGPALIMGWQKIAFDKDGQNVDAHGVISQNLKGKRVTIWPVANRPKGLTPVWPIPAWKDR